jgi:hypothetical protein
VRSVAERTRQKREHAALVSAHERSHGFRIARAAGRQSVRVDLRRFGRGLSGRVGSDLDQSGSLSVLHGETAKKFPGEGPCWSFQQC